MNDIYSPLYALSVWKPRAVVYPPWYLAGYNYPQFETETKRGVLTEGYNALSVTVHVYNRDLEKLEDHRAEVETQLQAMVDKVAADMRC